MNKQMTPAEIELVQQSFARLAPISDKAALSEIGASLVKLCWTSSISAGVICLFIFFSSSRFDFGATRKHGTGSSGLGNPR